MRQQRKPPEPITPDEIRELRLALGDTQTTLAATLGVSANTVARWEAGAVSPSAYYLVELHRLVRAVARQKAKGGLE